MKQGDTNDRTTRNSIKKPEVKSGALEGNETDCHLLMNTSSLN